MKLISYGANSSDVITLRKILNLEINSRLQMNPVYDTYLVEEVKGWQAANNIAVSGNYDKFTDNILGPKIAAKLLEEKDIPSIAAGAAFPASSVYAVYKYFGLTYGFLTNTSPVVIFEKDVFYSLLSNKIGSAAIAPISAANPDICLQEKGGYMYGAAELARYNKAVAVDSDIAMQSTRFGMFRTIGNAYSAAGYSGAVPMINDILLSEKMQLSVALKVISGIAGCASALRKRDFLNFYLLYTGKTSPDQTSAGIAASLKQLSDGYVSIA